MEQNQLDRETFSCSICLDLLKDPVTIPCGHSYCMSCITDHWDAEDQKGIHSCPQCRETFTPRPALKRSTMLAALVEQMKKTGLPAAPADHRYAGPEDVACEICTGRKLKAFKSCLVCLVSYCENHLQPHLDVPGLKNHKLVEASRNLQENICSQHDEVMKMFCRTDQKCICAFCLLDEHKGHDTVSAAAGRTERQRELEERRGNIQQRIQDREEDVKLLQQEVEAINHSADKTVEDSEEIFTKLIRLLQKRSSDVKHHIRSQQEDEVSRVKDVQEKLEQEISELKRKDAELEQLSHTEDHYQFLHNYPSLPLSESKHSSSINIQPEPEPRAGFLKYSCEITLDPNTAYRYLVLSEGNRKVTLIKQPQSSSSHPDRFTKYSQVLSRESLTGRCYWEVEWRGMISVAIAYKNISTAGQGKKCGFGGNDISWALDCSSSKFGHNNIWTDVSGPVSSRVGVYLDHRAGLLSFYSISETMTLIHRVQTTFTEPLHAGVTVGWFGASAEFCKPN
uniref:Tripartite motif-containing protein 16-like n=1 Tax=Poecilia mexicana TaxID=48701 RepID=A0A3B3YL14_9TELE